MLYKIGVRGGTAASCGSAPSHSLYINSIIIPDIHWHGGGGHVHQQRSISARFTPQQLLITCFEVLIRSNCQPSGATMTMREGGCTIHAPLPIHLAVLMDDTIAIAN